MTASHVAQAVAALTGKARRLRDSATSKSRDADGKDELADELEQLAPLLEPGADQVRQVLNQPVEQGISPRARKLAGNEIYSLALQRESQGSEHNALARVRAGWERGGDDLGLPIHRATLQEALALLELAEAIHPEPYWTWTRAGLLVRLGDYRAAAAAYGSAGGDYARHAPALIAQCEAKAAGTHDPVAEHARHVQALVARCQANGVDQTLIIEAQSVVGELIAEAAQRPEPAPAHDAIQQPPLADGRLDRAAHAAQTFAEQLAEGNFEEAQKRLSKRLKGTNAEALRRQYERMTMADEFPQVEPVEIIVMMAQDDMPNLEPVDLGWVYVAITGTMFNEALTLVVTEEDGAARIRSIEWGRP